MKHAARSKIICEVNLFQERTLTPVISDFELCLSLVFKTETELRQSSRFESVLIHCLRIRNRHRVNLFGGTFLWSRKARRQGERTQNYRKEQSIQALKNQLLSASADVRGSRCRDGRWLGLGVYLLHSGNVGLKAMAQILGR